MRVDLCYQTTDTPKNKIYILRDFSTMKEAIKRFKDLDKVETITYAYLRTFKNYHHYIVKTLRERK